MLEVINNIGSDWSDDSPTDYYINETNTMFNTIQSDELPDDIYEGIIPTPVSEKPVITGMIFDESLTSVPYKDDVIEVSFSPDELNEVVNILKSYSVSISNIENNKNITELYDKQCKTNETISNLDSYLNKYVNKRPWHPLLLKWVDNIGKKQLRNSVDSWST